MDVLRGNNRWGDDMQDDDLISRRAAIDDAHRQIWYRMNPSMKERIDAWLKDLPSVQPEPKKGHWVQISDGYIDCVKCELCGKLASDADSYCRGCGAKMER